MEIITRSMNEADAEELADYFARFPPKYSGRASKSSSYSKLYGVCADCHGVKGEGLGINPRIAGQHSLYTYRQLLQYKTGVRLQPEMRALLQGLPDDELKALADYLAALR